MFGFFAKKLTEYSNHYVDWSRVGELLRTGTHRYSSKEIRDRGIIVGAIVLGGFLGDYYHDEEDNNSSSFTLMAVGALAGFIASHAVIILPLVHKRLQMRKECDQLLNDIQNEIATTTPMLSDSRINEIIKSIKHRVFAVSLSDDKHARASQTWGNRKNLLNLIRTHLKENIFYPSFWHRDVNTIYEALVLNKPDLKLEERTPMARM